MFAWSWSAWFSGLFAGVALGVGILRLHQKWMEKTQHRAEEIMRRHRHMRAERMLWELWGQRIGGGTDRYGPARRARPQLTVVANNDQRAD